MKSRVIDNAAMRGAAARRFAARLGILVLVAVGQSSETLAEPVPLLDDLMQTAGFSEDDIRKLKDDPIARELPVPDRSTGIAFAAIIRLTTDGSRLTNGPAAVDPSNWPAGLGLFHPFSDPSKQEDLAELQFTDSDLEVLADCEIQKCKFKLQKAGIEGLRNIDWSKGDAGSRFTEMFRSGALAYVDRYRKTGNNSLVLYADKSKPVSLSSTVDKLVGQFVGFHRDAPAFTNYLLSTPEGRRPSISESIVWTSQDFGYRPTVTIDHILVDTEPEIDGAIALLASKLIYANHYLAGRVQMGAAVDGATTFGIPGKFIIMVDRLEFDDGLNGFKRGLLAHGLKSDIEARMKGFRSLADGQP